MKIKVLLILLIALQFGSCNKRYAQLKKIRVHHEKNSVITKTEKQPEEIDRRQLPETASIDSTGNWMLAPLYHPWEEPVVHHKQNPPTKLKHKNATKAEQSKQLSHQKQSVPEKEDKDNNALQALIFSVIALTLFLFLPLYPIAIAIAIFIFTILARNNGKTSYKNLRDTKNKRKWMAVFGLAVGTILLAFFIAAAILLPFFFVGMAEGALGAIFVLGILLAAIMLLLSFPPSKGNKSEPGKPGDPDQPNASSGRNKFANRSFLLLILTLLFAIFIVMFPILFAIITITCFSAAITCAIIGLKQIKLTHERGKWMALTTILFIPGLILLAAPILIIFILIGHFIWKRVKRNKLKKANKVTA